MGANKELDLQDKEQIPANNISCVFDLSGMQNELKVPKGNFNSFGKYKYRTAEDILEAVKPLLVRFKTTLTLDDNIVLIGDKFFVEAIATLNKTIITKGYAEISEHKGMSSEQTTGTASSYARKYALNGMFLIDETESDPDNKTENKPTTKPDEKQWLNPKTEAWTNAIKALASGKYLIKDIEKKYKLSTKNKELLLSEVI